LILRSKGGSSLNQENIKGRLKKLKVLAEQGIDGEKETALKMYEELKCKYNLSDNEILDEPILLEFFRYKDNIENRLLQQICYMVTGSTEIWARRDKKYKLVGCYCTEFEKAEIELYFEYYKRHLESELDIFMTAFCSTNNLYPDENARCYKEPEIDCNQDNAKRKKAALMATFMEGHARPRKQLNEGKS
jgi:hypothetical protein